MITIGDPAAQTKWVYFCGLTSDFYSEKQLEVRALLDQIGRESKISFLAVEPLHRSVKYSNALNWPHESDQITLRTFLEIQEALPSVQISGYMGFSNGGFFLNTLAQLVSLGCPIVSIGAGGQISGEPMQNRIYLFIGKEDRNHYESALRFYKQSQGTALEVTLIEYPDGHVIPKALLEQKLPTF